MPLIHEINCDCCEPKSEGASLILDKIHEILGGAPTPDKSVITSLKEVSNLFKSVNLTEVNKDRLEAGLDPYTSTPSSSNNIDEIVKIAEAFLTSPVNEVSLDQIQLDKIDKKLGKFNVADLSDSPGLDITKLIDLSKINLNGLDKLQFSISTPTIMVEKTLKIGPVSIGFKFIISLKEIAWFPVVGIDKSLLTTPPPLNLPKPKNVNDLKKNIKKKNEADRSAAMDSLKDVKSLQPVTASTKKPVNIKKPDPNDAKKTLDIWKMVPMSLADMKTLARNTYGSSKDIMKVVNDAVTKEMLVENLSKIGAVLYQEVDIHKEMQAMLDNDKLLSIAPVYEDEDCGTPDVIPTPFTAEDLKEIQKDCCNDDAVEAVAAAGASVSLGATSPPKSIDDLLNDIVKNNPPNGGLKPEDEAKEVEDIQKFLDKVNAINAVMTQCAKEKQNALNNYWWYTEASYLNRLAIEYTEARANMIDALNGKFTSLETARQEKIKRNIELKKQESKLIADTYDRLRETSYYTFMGTTVSTTGSQGAQSTQSTSFVSVLEINSRKISQDQKNQIEQDQTFKQAVKSIRTEFTNNETDIAKLSSQIKDQKRNFQLPTLSQSELQNLKTVDLANESSVLKIKTKEFRKNFDIITCPVTNQVGFDFRPFSSSIVTSGSNTYVLETGSHFPGANISLYVDSSIFEESKTLFALNSPAQGDMSDYVKKATSREKTFGDVWAKYYSPNRIDLLFTYQEQGYTNPKPQYDASGNPLGPKTTVTIKNPLGGEEKLQVAESVSKLDVNEAVALDFWQNLEAKTNAKMILLLKQWRESSAYKTYVSKIRAAAENEAKYAFSVNLIYQENSYNTRAFNSYTNSFSFSQAALNNSLSINADTNGLAVKFENMYELSYNSVRKFQDAIQKKISDIDKFIEIKKKCIADGEKDIENTAVDLSKKKSALDNGAGAGAGAGAGGAVAVPNDLCPPKLGTDPFGLKPIGNCPGPVKNCYWKEYTKKMQLVSVMPIPDVEQLFKRLFRYYPVAIQIPVPVPAPVVLPTLALGIPDPLISIPLPIVWKHIITISLPVGMFVIWIGLCGPIPGPYIMYIDEQMNPMFLVSPKGPIQIPANSLKVQDIENKSLIEMLNPLNISFKLPMIEPFNDLMIGKKKIPGSFLKTDPDHPSTVIDNLQKKIKNAVDSIKAEDIEPDFGQNDANEEKRKQAREKIQRIKKAFDQFPPDTEAISDALKAVEKSVDKAVDGMKISSIKFPKDPKRLAVPQLGFAEFLEDINKLLDTKIDLGLPIKTISLKKEIKKLFDRLLSDPEIKEAFKKLNEDIADLEDRLAISGGADTEKVKARIKEIKKSAKAVAKKGADVITPEMLGFVAALTIPIPLPFPCYDNITLPPVPPYIMLIMAAVKQLPSLIDGIPDEALAKALKIDLKARLPKVEDAMFFITDALLNFVPDLSFPDPQSATVIKNAVLATVQNFFKIKIRPPHPGAVQIVIPESLIKNLVKTAIKAAIAVVIALIMKELNEAVAKNDVAKVLAVAAIIKAIFSTDLGNLSGEDLKAFLASTLDTVDAQLEQVKSLLISIPKVDFKSLKETLFPPAILESLKKKPLKKVREGPFLEVNTKAMLNVANPALSVLQKLNLPFPVVLLGCALTPTRIVLSKVHPFSPKQVLPSWEMLSLKNIPWLIFLDQLIATAQRSGGLVSDYVVPYYLPDPPA